ncbi:Histone acetyltransferase type B catalytic subunit, partial [Frankliniella fusca]
RVRCTCTAHRGGCSGGGAAAPRDYIVRHCINSEDRTETGRFRPLRFPQLFRHVCLGTSKTRRNKYLTTKYLVYSLRFYTCYGV